MAASNDAAQHGGRWTLIDDEGNVQGSDSDIGSVSSSDCVAVEEDAVSYRAKRTNSRSSTGNSVSGSPPRNQIEPCTDTAQNVPPSSSWLGGFWTKGRSPANSDCRLNDLGENEPLPPVFQQEKDTIDTESLESIEVLSMPSDSHSDTDNCARNQHEETPVTFDPVGAVGGGWNRHGDVVKAMSSTNVVSPIDGLNPSSRVEDMASSSNSSQLDFLVVNNPGPKNGAVRDETAANDYPRGAVGGNATDEEDQMEQSIGIAGPLPIMPHGHLPLSSVSVDNIPRGVEAGGSPRRAQSEGCIPQQSEESGVGVPIMTQRWPTEDGGFLLVQQFRGDGEPAMSRSSSFSDLSSSFSYPGGRRRIPTNSTSSLQRQSSETSSSEASHYNSDSSTDALPANMTVSGIKPGIRQYRHRRDESLNSKLTMGAMMVVTAAMALVLGHYIGSMQATSHHLGIEAGQVWRLRSLQDQLVTCLDKTKTLLRGARASAGGSQAKATSPLDSQPSAKLLDPPVDAIQQSNADSSVSCSACNSEDQPQTRYSEFCNTQCKHNNDDKGFDGPLSSGHHVSNIMLMSDLNGEKSLDLVGIGGGVTDGTLLDVRAVIQTQGEPEVQWVDTVTKSSPDDEGNADVAVDMPSLSDIEPVRRVGPGSVLFAGEESLLEQNRAAEAEEDDRETENVQEIPREPELRHEDAPAYEVDSSSTKEKDTQFEIKVDTEDKENSEFQDQVEEGSQDLGEEEFLKQDPGEEKFLEQDQGEEEFLEQDQGEEEFLEQDQGEEEFLEQDQGEEEFLEQDQGEEELLNRGEEKFSDSSSSSTEDEDFGSQEETFDSPDDENFMETLSSKLSDSWFILRNFTTDLVGSASNLSVNNVTTQLKENVETLRHQIQDAVSNLQKSNITSHLKDSVNSIGEHIKDAVSNIREGNFSRTVKDTVQDLGGKVGEALSGIKATNITSQIKEGLHGLGETIQGAVSSVKQSGIQLKKPFRKTMKAVRNLMKGKPVNSEKETHEDQPVQEDRVEPKKKPSTNKNSGKSNRKPSEQGVKQKSEKNDPAKNRRKEGRKKNNAPQKDTKDKSERKNNNRKNNKGKDQINQYTEDKQEKSHSDNINEKRESSGKINIHEKKPLPNQIDQHTDKDNQQKKRKRNDKITLNDDTNEKKYILKEAQGNEENHKQRHSKHISVPSRKSHGMHRERKREMEETVDLKDQPGEIKHGEEHLINKEKRKKEDEKRNHESKESTQHQDHQRKHSHHQERNDHPGHRHEDKRPSNDHQDKEDDARHRFEDIEWEDIFESFDVRCFGVHDCLRKQREAAVKLYEELLDYRDWLTDRRYKKHLEELKDFMEELEEFLAEPFLKDADLEELMEDFEDMAEDIEKATTKNFWKFMKAWTPRHTKADPSNSKEHSKGGSKKKKSTKESKEETLTVTLDLKQTFNFSETIGDDVPESKDHRRHAGYGYQSNDDWFIRRMQDRENSRTKKDHDEALDNHQTDPNSNWYYHWMQGREEGRTGMTVWDLYQWFSKRQAIRHEWRLHEMDDQSNWFLRRP